MADNDIKSYLDLAKFVSDLPGSGPPGGMIDKYDNAAIIDPLLEKDQAAKEAVYILDKYRVTPIDRRKIIAAILNIKTIGIK